MTLDRDQVALASARNIGALAMIKRKRPAQLSTVNVTFDSTYRASADTCRQTHPTTRHTRASADTCRQTHPTTRHTRASADTCRQTHPTTLHLPHQPEKGSPRVSEPLDQAQSNLGH
jgi:hypothetical protein